MRKKNKLKINADNYFMLKSIIAAVAEEVDKNPSCEVGPCCHTLHAVAALWSKIFKDRGIEIVESHNTRRGR